MAVAENSRILTGTAAYDEGEAHVDSKVRERFLRKPYEVDDVAGYMAKKYDIKKEVAP